MSAWIHHIYDKDGQDLLNAFSTVDEVAYRADLAMERKGCSDPRPLPISEKERDYVIVHERHQNVCTSLYVRAMKAEAVAQCCQAILRIRACAPRMDNACKQQAGCRWDKPDWAQ